MVSHHLPVSLSSPPSLLCNELRKQNKCLFQKAPRHKSNNSFITGKVNLQLPLLRLRSLLLCGRPEEAAVAEAPSYNDDKDTKDASTPILPPLLLFVQRIPHGSTTCLTGWMAGPGRIITWTRRSLWADEN